MVGRKSFLTSTANLKDISWYKLGYYGRPFFVAVALLTVRTVNKKTWLEDWNSQAPLNDLENNSKENIKSYTYTTIDAIWTKVCARVQLRNLKGFFIFNSDSWLRCWRNFPNAYRIQKRKRCQIENKNLKWIKRKSEDCGCDELNEVVIQVFMWEYRRRGSLPQHQLNLTTTIWDFLHPRNLSSCDDGLSGGLAGRSSYDTLSSDSYISARYRPIKPTHLS